MNKQFFDISVVIPKPRTMINMTEYLSQVHLHLERLELCHEVLVVDFQFHAIMQEAVQKGLCSFIGSQTDEYGDAILSGVGEAAGKYILIIEAGSLLPETLLKDLWESRDIADVLIASRYVSGGEVKVPLIRNIMSKALNLVFSRGLDLDVYDISSSYRLYKSHVIKNLTVNAKGFDVLQEILVRILLEGYTIKEIPFTYISNDPSYERLFNFGIAYLKTFWKLWKLRNSIASADYDARAYNAMMPPQRYWQRQRFKHITGMLKNKGKCLDVGCGSSRIIAALPHGSIALDILIRKLRYARRFKHANIQGSIFNLPVPDQSFPCVLCSQVIEHVPRANVLDELDRVLQPGGYLILGTPDYAKWQWNFIEWLYKVLLPQAYADEHITHYTFRELYDEMVTKRGYKLDLTRYILQGELILGLRKPSG